MATFIIAEAGVNHNGSLTLALKLIDAAKDAGADAVKFQTFQPEKHISRHAVMADYQQKVLDSSVSQLDMVRPYYLDAKAHQRLAEHCETLDIEFMSTPFDIESLELLCSLGVRRLKIASGELTNAPLLVRAALSKLPLIVSTGMSEIREIRATLQLLAYATQQEAEPPNYAALASLQSLDVLQNKVTLLHCTTAYPTKFSEVNLRAMDTLREIFGLPTGLSDHSVGVSVPIAAAAREATVVEKHFTLDQSLEGPDHHASLNPIELREMVTRIREVEAALGDGKKETPTIVKQNRTVLGKSLVAARVISAGEKFSATNLTAKRPSGGVNPMLYWDYLGLTSSRDYEEDELIDSEIERHEL